MEHSPGLILGVIHVGTQAEAGSGIAVDAASIGPARIHQMEWRYPHFLRLLLPHSQGCLTPRTGWRRCETKADRWLAARQRVGILLAAGLSP